MSAQPKSLKRLGFVKSYADWGTGLLASGYGKARGLVPGYFAHRLEQLEDAVASTSTPYITRAQDVAAKGLFLADDQVDATLNALDASAKFGNDLHMEGLASYSKAKANTYAHVEATINSIISYLNPFPYFNAFSEFTKWALDTTISWADPDKVIDLGAGYASTFSKYPVVSTVVDRSKPLTDPVLKQADSMRSQVVSLPIYKQAYDTIFNTLSSIESTPAYKSGKDILYPYVAPIADPVYSNFSRSKYVDQLSTSLKPKYA